MCVMGVKSHYIVSSIKKTEGIQHHNFGSQHVIVQTLQKLKLNSFNSTRVRSISVEWRPPPSSSFKLNFDGFSIGNLGPSGFGCVIQDHGLLTCIIAGLTGICDSTKAEVMGLLIDLREIKRIEIGSGIVEGASKVVGGWGLGISQGSWQYWNLINE